MLVVGAVLVVYRECRIILQGLENQVAFITARLSKRSATLVDTAGCHAPLKMHSIVQNVLSNIESSYEFLQVRVLNDTVIVLQVD